VNPAPHRRSIAAYRAILRLYPRAFRDHWAEETLLLFADLSRRQPAVTALWRDNLPDLVRGLVAEWWQELARRPWRNALAHGAVAGTLLSTATVAGNLGQLWSTPAGRVSSWLITGAALTVLALAGRSTVTIGQALRSGLFGGLIALTLANVTATVIVVACFDHLRHDPLQLAAFAASHEPDFRTYQANDLLGGWLYGSTAGAVLGTVGSGAGAMLSRMVRAHRT